MSTSFSLGDIEIRGTSVAGVMTSLYVPSLKSLLDVGRMHPDSVGAKRLFISHGHADHIGAIGAFLGLRAMMCPNITLSIYLPKEIEPQLSVIIENFQTMQRYNLDVELIGMEPGQDIDLGKGLTVSAIRTFHPVPSLGYIFSDRVSKLRDEYRGLSGDEIKERKRSGEDLFATIQRPRLAYCTDTLATVLDKNPALYQVPVLILECSFLDERKSLKDTRAGCHIHLTELIERAPEFNNEYLALMHFSQLYTRAEVTQLVGDKLDAFIKPKVVPLVR